MMSLYHSINIYNTNVNQQKVNINVKKMGFFDICRFLMYKRTCSLGLFYLRVYTLCVHVSPQSCPFKTNCSAENPLRQYIVI
jgi:hypothetical protein